MKNIAIGSKARWNKVKHLFKDYKFYKKAQSIPVKANKVLFVIPPETQTVETSSDETYYIPEREYSKINPKPVKIDGSKPHLTKIEFHIANNCNLNCNSCNHFCNIESENSFPIYENVKNDLMRLKELYWGIGTLYLVGGEPFLNPELPKYCNLVRELFPESDISVITNGILLCKDLANKTLESMEKNEIKLLISKYPINLKDIETKLKTFSNLKYSFTQEINNFTKKLTLNDKNNAKKSYKNCHERECHYLENGKIYGCTLFGRVKKLNDVFGTNYPDVGIDIYKVKDGWELNDKIENVYPYCSYCSNTYEYTKWSCGGKADIMNYIATKPNKEWLKTQVLKFKDKIVHK